LGIPNSAPLITPTLRTKIVNFKFDMANADDWEAGIQPFNFGNRGTTCAINLSASHGRAAGDAQVNL
jgi:hypothetical protein